MSCSIVSNKKKLQGNPSPYKSAGAEKSNTGSIEQIWSVLEFDFRCSAIVLHGAVVVFAAVCFGRNLLQMCNEESGYSSLWHPRYALLDFSKST